MGTLRGSGCRSLSALDLAVAREINRIVSENVVDGEREPIVRIEHISKTAAHGIGRQVEAQCANGLVVVAELSFFLEDDKPVYRLSSASYFFSGLVVCPNGHAFFPGNAIRIDDFGHACPVCYTAGQKFVGPNFGPKDICPECRTLPLKEVYAGCGESYFRCDCGATTRPNN